MESPSEAPHSGGSPWKGLLITASILSCWIQASSAQGAPVTVVPSPPYGTVGSSVILDIRGFSGEAISYNWYRRTRENSTSIAFYCPFSGEQTPADNREKVLPNGSLLIPNLTLSDTDLYIVSIADSSTTLIAEVQLTVYAEGNVSSLSGGAVAGIVIGVLAAVALTGTLIYFLFFRDTGRASKHHLPEETHSALKLGEDATMYENTAFPKGSALPAQGLGSSTAFPEVPSEGPYQALNTFTLDVYDRIEPLKKPQT
ncbi:carcinoembryonic antigen-related cell adhesion molecule 4-like [Dromiciops gliroides]|uniref:carcinoembryonic antigen-related cell adhesion molecule 4-like n=1 Tax=Dromiciops gliroides TaxID=33562 RepID=UPI001CC808A5|nr:carcinoembryonic antigen-related cell adhesion molecule 4-like [Dromiciops gliroides]